MTRTLDLERRQLASRRVDGPGEPPEQAGAVGRRDPGPGGPGRGRPVDRPVGLRGREPRDGPDELLRRRVEDRRRGGHSRSKPRNRSQSVTAAS